ncbi:MAG: hypothetical protein HRU69_06340 [Flammeovirgaceae bacterium]|nr:MAG: hypothetical protein HRU69_06340 [Flammeovirgaceae bacterium]
MRRLDVILITLIFTALNGWAQNPNGRNGLAENKISRKIIRSITTNEKDTTINQKSEQAFMPYQGRIIRKIIIQKIGFERSIYDTTKRKIANDITRIANSLHTNTRVQVIKDNLFFKEKKPLDPYKLADNERHLRDLDFILDATILVRPVRRTRDSVDVLVVTRDVFSLGGSFTPSSTDRYRFGIYDANLGGLGQRIELNALYDADRDPTLGTQFLYSKNSVGGTFINATVSYTQLNNGSSLGLENENAVFLRLDRPLVSPYTRMAGGIEFSQNWSVNAFNKPATDFREYQYGIRDLWIGYNIGVKNRMKNRNRHFVALRSFKQHFSDKPWQAVEQDNPLYNNKSFVLGEVSFFNQNFYKTRYIYGFGRTEDIPYGRQLTLLAGKVSQLGRNRPYLGAELIKSFVQKNGDFYSFTLSAGGFYFNDRVEDVLLLANASMFSRIIDMKRFKLRHSLAATYTTILKPAIIFPLQITSEFGLKQFRADSLLGNKRLGIHAESVLFTPLSILGFRIAPILFADAALIAPQNQNLFRQQAYFALGGGIRTRNENLVFGTIELRCYYFPVVVEDLSHFRITLSSNLQVKYSAGFVKKPAFIRYN